MSIEAINHTMMLHRAARIMQEIRRNNEEFDKDRRDNGWTSRNPSCKHGTFIGDPYGADYLCGYCEDGTSDYEIALGHAKRQVEADNERWNEIMTVIIGLDKLFRWDDHPPEGLKAVEDELSSRARRLTEQYQ